MAQPSVANYFNARKRSAVEQIKINSAKKVLVLDNNEPSNDFLYNNVTANVVKVDYDELKNDSSLSNSRKLQETEKTNRLNKINSHKSIIAKPHKKMVATRSKPQRTASSNGDIQSLWNNMKNADVKIPEKISSEIPTPKEIANHVTPPNTPTKQINALDKVNEKAEGPSLKEIKRKLTRSSRLAELKASLSRFQDKAEQLKEIEKKTSEIPESPKLKSFRSIELEIQSSPTKVFSPEKQYLSPKKDLGARRNLFSHFSPTKNAVALSSASPSKKILQETSKPALTLPYKYRYLAEIFRSIDTVCQILFNRKEIITFRKLKPAVEEMLKRNLLEKHLAQINSIFPSAFKLSQEKVRVFGTGMKQEQWELVVAPNITGDHINSEILLQRRRKLFNILLDQVKHYHDEFLSSLDPPITIDKEKLTRWHPEFDIEKLPDIEISELPQPPVEEKFSSGQDVLERARQIFNCNSRMEQALQKLKEMKKEEVVADEQKEEGPPVSVLKGIPKALLEKVRQKQAAKALISMTRSVDMEKELKVYSRLPELARLTRNLFVSEKKSVLSLDVLLEKLDNCYRARLTRAEMEQHVRVIAKEFPTWLVFHIVRNAVYVKLSKSDDLSLIIQKLERLAKEKSEL